MNIGEVKLVRSHSTYSDRVWKLCIWRKRVAWGDKSVRLNEADTRAKLIDPAIYNRGWTEDLIKREQTAGAIEIIGGKGRRRAQGRIDYVLRIRVHKDTQPVAVALIEAKAANLPPGHGLEQVKAYAECKLHNVPWVFSTNGHLFVEYDRFTQKTSPPRSITEFPTPRDLQKRYEYYAGFSLQNAAAKPLLIPYKGGEATRRYYQDAAIRAAMEKIAHCEINGEPKRALLSLATGAGKTFIAVNLLHRIATAGQLRRALFVCDRDELRTQATLALQNMFGSDAAPVSTSRPEKNARVLIATYQTLGVDTDDADATFLMENYPVDYFSHIVIDECHRSAWGKWSQVLTRNPNAVQIGLTATPRKLKGIEYTPESTADLKISADNIRYFGEPVYEYDMAQGIEDGYLAACEIVRSEVDLDQTGITIDNIMPLNPVDAITGKPLTEEQIRGMYQARQYEDKILLPDRVLAMCTDLFNHLVNTGGPEQKTIIFCVRDRHADDVAATMGNLYADWCAKNGKTPMRNYAFKCTAASSGSDYISDLKASSSSHFIAATVDLLTTGVDVPAVRNIVFFKYVKSPIAFYQMVGRGTRIDVDTNKLMFRVYDYTNATRLFGEDFTSRATRAHKPSEDIEDVVPEPIVQVSGLDAKVTEAGHSIITMIEGRAVPVPLDEYKQIIAAKLIEEAPTLEEFRRRWIDPPNRQELIASLPAAGNSVYAIRELSKMDEYDLFDVLAELGYGLAPRSRKERAEAFSYKHEQWVDSLPKEAANAVNALVGQFAENGTDALESTYVFRMPEVIRAGGLQALRQAGEPGEVLRSVKERMFAA